MKKLAQIDRSSSPTDDVDKAIRAAMEIKMARERKEVVAPEIVDLTISSDSEDGGNGGDVVQKPPMQTVLANSSEPVISK